MKSDLHALEPAKRATAAKAAGRKVARDVWGERNNAYWGRRKELENLAGLGGSVVGCAEALGVGRGMLRGWIDHQTQKCWIPLVLFPKLDAYLDGLKAAPPAPSPAAASVEAPVFVILDPVLNRASDVVVAPSLAHVSLRVSELPNGNRPPVLEGEKMPIACHIKLMPRGESREFEFGILEASLVVRISRANHGRFRPAPSTPAVPGAAINSHPTETRLQVDIVSEDGKALRLRGIEGPAVVLGDYVGSRVGDEIVVELFVPADHGFAMQPRRGVFVVAEVLPMNARRCSNNSRSGFYKSQRTTLTSRCSRRHGATGAMRTNEHAVQASFAASRVRPARRGDPGLPNGRPLRVGGGGRPRSH